MDDVPMLFFYMGKNVDDMTREELLVAVKELGKMADDGFKRATDIHGMYKLFEDVRKARGYA